MKRLLLVALLGVMTVCVTGFILLYVPPVNRAIWPPRTPTAEVFDPQKVASEEEVMRVLGPAPAGYAWRYERDSDASLLSARLVNATDTARAIEPAVYERFYEVRPPRGYHWGTQRRDPSAGRMGEVIQVCLSRLVCAAGQVPGTHRCRRIAFVLPGRPGMR